VPCPDTYGLECASDNFNSRRETNKHDVYTAWSTAYLPVQNPPFFAPDQPNPPPSHGSYTMDKRILSGFILLSHSRIRRTPNKKHPAEHMELGFEQRIRTKTGQHPGLQRQDGRPEDSVRYGRGCGSSAVGDNHDSTWHQLETNNGDREE